MTGWRSRLRRRRWLVVLPVVVALIGLLAGLGSLPGSRSQLRGLRLTAAQEKLVVRAAAAARTNAARLAADGARPTCSPPPLPAEVDPNGVHGYGVPFVAELTNATILSGYSEWTADHTNWSAGSQNYHLYPWASSLSGVSGWISGTLDFPSLTAQIPASNIHFCDTGGTACFNPLPSRPLGQCLFVSLGQGAALARGAQPGAAETNMPLDPVTLSGPTSLKPGESEPYTFTAPSRGALSSGISTTFTGQTSSGQVSGTGMTYYTAYPYDSYNNQFLALSDETINGHPADEAPGRPVTPGSTITVGVTVTDTSTEPVFVTDVERYDDILNNSPVNVVLTPAHPTTTVKFTTTAGSGGQAVMIEVQGTMRNEPAQPSQGFGAAYYYTGARPVLAVSNETVNGQPAGASALTGVQVGSTYTGKMTLTNTGSSTITDIKGATASASCWNFTCLHYLVTLRPTGTATLKVTGVGADGSLEVAGTASSLTTLSEYFTPTLFFSATQLDAQGNPAPTSVSLSSQETPLPPAAPTAPSPGNPDDRGIQVTPQGLHGPFQSASGTVVGNDFSVPAFSSPLLPGLASVLNTPLAGWGAAGVSNWNCPPAAKLGQCPAIAGHPGWNQFAAQAVVYEVGLPQGVPSQFSW